MYQQRVCELASACVRGVLAQQRMRRGNRSSLQSSRLGATACDQVRQPGQMWLLVLLVVWSCCALERVWEWDALELCEALAVVGTARAGAGETQVYYCHVHMYVRLLAAAGVLGYGCGVGPGVCLRSVAVCTTTAVQVVCVHNPACQRVYHSLLDIRAVGVWLLPVCRCHPLVPAGSCLTTGSSSVVQQLLMVRLLCCCWQRLRGPCMWLGMGQPPAGATAGGGGVVVVEVGDVAVLPHVYTLCVAAPVSCIPCGAAHSWQVAAGHR